MLSTYIIINLIHDEPFKIWSIKFSILMIINFVLELIIFKSLKIKILSVTSLIPLMSYLFQFGDTFTYAIGFEESRLIGRIFYYTSISAYKTASEIAIYSIFAFSLGGIILSLNNDKKSKKRNEYKKINTKFYLFLGCCLIIISLPLYVYECAYEISTIISLGSYTALAHEKLPGYITSFGKMIYIGLFFIMFYYRQIHSEIKYKFTTIVFLFLIAINMALGARSEPMTILFAYLIFHKQCVKTKVKSKQIIFYCIAIYVLADFMYAIQISRNTGFDISNIINIFLDSGIKVFLNETFEFGTTIFSTAVVVERITEHHPSWFIIKELCSLTPVPISSEYSVVGSVMAGVPELGTSFVGEMFYYFGNYCYLACFSIAIYIKSIENWIDKKIKQGDYFHFLMFMMWMWQQLNCIRASYTLSLKTIIYSFVLMEILYFLYKQIYGEGIFKTKRFYKGNINE